MNDKKNWQVLIVGGGPAGIATSLTLTARGITNCVIEATEKPLLKHGESVPPNAKPILNKLGLGEVVENEKHRAYFGIKSRWGTSSVEQKDLIRGVYGDGFLLDRLYFEEQIRAHLIDQGGTLLSGCRVLQVNPFEGGVEVLVNGSTGKQRLLSEYVVDATGRKASVCSKLGAIRSHVDEQYALTLRVSLERTIPNEIIVESTESGWWYCAPQKNHELILMFFTAKSLLPEKSSTVGFMKQNLSQTELIKQQVNFDQLKDAPIKVMPAGTSRIKRPYGDRWVAVGDAAYTYDPISSYGIASGLSSGFYGGNALASHIKGEPDAFKAYHYLMEMAFSSFLEKSAIHYSKEQRWTDSPFWKEKHEHLIERAVIS